MMTGIVNERNQAMLWVQVRGAKTTSEVEAVLDTGFNGFLTLSASVVAELGLTLLDAVPTMLATGDEVLLSVFGATVEWDGQERQIFVLEAEGDALLGMALLENQRVTLEVRAGGRIGIEALA